MPTAQAIINSTRIACGHTSGPSRSGARGKVELQRAREKIGGRAEENRKRQGFGERLQHRHILPVIPAGAVARERDPRRAGICGKRHRRQIPDSRRESVGFRDDRRIRRQVDHYADLVISFPPRAFPC